MSELDWHSAPLSDATLIDANYRNTQNVRRYFKARLGEHFKMTRPFMAWMKANPGKTLDAALSEWRKMHKEPLE